MAPVAGSTLYQLTDLFTGYIQMQQRTSPGRNAARVNV
jgi:hypothetical protein